MSTEKKAAEWADQIEASAVCGQAECDRSIALVLAADDVESGRNEYDVPDDIRADVARRLRAASECYV